MASSLVRLAALLWLLACGPRAEAQVPSTTGWAPPAPAETRLPPPPVEEPRASGAPLPSSALRGGRVPSRVSVAPDSHRTDLTLYVDRGLNPALGIEAGAGGFQPLCRAPCEFRLRNGRHRFAVTWGDASKGEQSRLVKVRPELLLQHGDQLILRHRSRRWLRVLGWAVIAGCTATAAVLAGTSQRVEDGPVDKRRLAWAGALSGVAVLGGITMVVWPDRVTGRVERQ